MTMNVPEENENDLREENKSDPRNDVHTVVSNNENIDPIPDDEQLEKKKDPKNQN